jgi:hypothetical protein
MVLGGLLAQNVRELGGTSGQIGGKPAEGFGPWGDIFTQQGGTAATKFAGVLSNLLGVMTIIGGLWFMINLLVGGYNYLAAGESSEKMKEATRQIGNALIGLVVVIASYAVISLISGLVGFKILDVETNIGKIKPQ